MHARIQHLETQAETRFTQHQTGLISQFTSEANQALESQRENLISEASIGLSRRDEHVQHLQAELQFLAAQAAGYASESHHVPAACF